MSSASHLRGRRSGATLGIIYGDATGRGGGGHFEPKRIAGEGGKGDGHRGVSGLCDRIREVKGRSWVVVSVVSNPSNFGGKDVGT